MLAKQSASRRAYARGTKSSLVRVFLPPPQSKSNQRPVPSSLSASFHFLLRRGLQSSPNAQRGNYLFFAEMIHDLAQVTQQNACTKRETAQESKHQPPIAALEKDSNMKRNSRTEISAARVWCTTHPQVPHECQLGSHVCACTAGVTIRRGLQHTSTDEPQHTPMGSATTTGREGLPEKILQQTKNRKGCQRKNHGEAHPVS